MVTLYIYDITQGKDKKEYNRVKRSFYYNLSKMAGFSFLSKSVLIAEDEDIFDSFFSKYRGKIICFKIRSEDIERLI